MRTALVIPLRPQEAALDVELLSRKRLHQADRPRVPPVLPGVARGDTEVVAAVRAPCDAELRVQRQDRIVLEQPRLAGADRGHVDVALGDPADRQRRVDAAEPREPTVADPAPQVEGGVWPDTPEAVGRLLR